MADLSVSDRISDEGVQTVSRVRRLVLAGNPNAGKSTIFNLLTGLRQRVGNFPGVTVERKAGRLIGVDGVEVVDVPGTYSLNPKSLDEQIAFDVLTGRLAQEPEPDLVVCVVDATNLERNLYLATQIMDLGLPTVVALNMMDEVEAAGLSIDVAKLERELGTPVVGMTASRGEGLEALRAAILGTVPVPTTPRWRLAPSVRTHVQALAAQLGASNPALSSLRRFGEALRALAGERVLAGWEKEDPAFYAAVREARAALQAEGTSGEQAEAVGRYGWLRTVAARVTLQQREVAARRRSDRLDAVLLHPVAGPILFVLILLLIFQAIFSWAVPAMDLIEAGLLALGDGVRAVLPAGLVTDLLVEGVVAGVGNVLVFLPQILLLFFFLGLMENTGYMARTAFIMDRVMRRVGLNGGSVVPMLSGFACAVPGIMAARTMENQRDRLVTIMVVPLMSCSARLPVYTLFIAAFIPLAYQGLTMFGLYMLGVATAFVAAWVINGRLVRGESGFFMLELPPYRAPQFRLILWRMYERAKVFVISAGRIILFFSVLLWVLASYPRVEPSQALQARRAALQQQAAALQAQGAGAVQADAAARLADQLAAVENAEAAYRMEHSFIGRFGHFIEPVMRPLGYDWKLSAGLITAFAAREVIISSLGTIYSVADAEENSIALRDQLRADRDPVTGEPVYTPLVALSLLVFFVLALQCMSTLAVARRELNSWRWPIFMWFYMTGLAYLAALIVYQGGRALGFG